MSSSTPTITSFAKSATVLLGLAVVFYGLAQYLLWGLETDAAEFPVQLHEGREFTAEFQAKWNVYYEIRLDSERNLDLQQQNCLLGIETIVPERCARVPPELLLSWQVETNNSIVVSGNSDDTNEGYWDLKMGKVLGSFPAAKRKIYRIRVQVTGSSSTLQQTNPRIKVKVRPEDLKWTYVWVGMLIQAAAFCFLLALVLLLILCGRKLRARLNSIDS
ncbi:MAG: hypothetical protein GY802_02325 [Gammaproteobacteria bacterium]|nr:hypothetical protein [Gammaproteobacteria bacterium]